ncbi:hypothetical protein ACAG39_01920 [Caldicellulosiruptoraceae bacterium PP1]
MQKKYCYFCDKDVEYEIKDENIKLNIDGKTIEFIGKIARCSLCGHEIDCEEIEKENIKMARKKLALSYLEENIDISECNVISLQCINCKNNIVVISEKDVKNLHCSFCGGKDFKINFSILKR